MTTVLDRSQRKLLLYIDGSLNTSSDATSLGSADLNAAAGAQLYTYNVFAGAVDELRLYNRALTSAEVSQLYSYAPGPSAYLTFEEGTGTTIFDKSGNNYSAYWQGSGSHWAPGKYGGGANFDGATDFINFTTLPKPASMPFTMMFWAKPRTASPVGIFDSASGQIDVLRNYSAGNVEWWSGAPTVSLGLTANQWAHLAFIFNYVGGTQTITYYKNGIQQASTSTAGDGQFAWTTMRLGNINAGTAGWYSGALDEFKIYSYARTSKQIVEDMNAGHPSGGSPVASQVGYWKFDEGFGTITQNAGNGGVGLSGVFGTGTSAPTWSNDGKYGKAISFTAPQNVKVNAAAAFNYGQGGFTYSAWVKANVLNAAYNMVMGQWLPYFDIYTNRLHLSMNAGGGQQSVWGNTQTLTTGQWYHIAASYDTSGYMKVYLNGKLDGTAGPYLTMANYGNNLYFGTWQVDGSYPFNGLIDDVKIYNYALTNAEIALDYNRGAAMQLGTLSKNTGNTAPSSAGSQEYCVPGDSATCSPPVARWDFEEGVGTTAYDVSGNNNHALLNSSPSWINSKSGFGKALAFNGSTTYLSSSTGDISVTNAITVEAWIKSSDAGTTYAGIITKDDATNRSWKMGYDITGQFLRFDIFNAGTYSSNQSTKAINDQLWHHVVGVYNGSTITTFVDGNPQSAPTPLTGGIRSSIAQIVIGKDGCCGGRVFNGKIDAIRIFNYARTPAQIALDYNRGGPVGWWKLDECQGSIAYDSSGVGNTGLITIGAGGTQTTVGTCGIGGTTAWGVGATGKFNSSLNFDGTDDYVTINDTVQPTSGLTISA